VSHSVGPLFRKVCRDLHPSHEEIFLPVTIFPQPKTGILVPPHPIFRFRLIAIQPRFPPRHLFRSLSEAAINILSPFFPGSLFPRAPYAPLLPLLSPPFDWLVSPLTIPIPAPFLSAFVVGVLFSFASFCVSSAGPGRCPADSHFFPASFLGYFCPLVLGW